MEILDGFEYLDEVIALFAEYKNFLGLDLSFQPADETSDEIVNRYKDGKIFISKIDSKFAGVIAYHRMEDPQNCELKRFFVRKEFRGLKIGRFLIEHAINSARLEGYRSIFLDTHEDLKLARHLYESLGFKKIPPYYFNPLEKVVYYRLKLEVMFHDNEFE